MSDDPHKALIADAIKAIKGAPESALMDALEGAYHTIATMTTERDRLLAEIDRLRAIIAKIVDPQADEDAV